MAFCFPLPATFILQAGDKAETTGIAEVFCKDRTEPLLIGSVKSNMGHSEATAGMQNRQTKLFSSQVLGVYMKKKI